MENTEEIVENGISGEESNYYVKAVVNVKMPNFDVLDNRKSEVLTLIMNAEIPKQYEGYLVRLNSDDLEYLEMAMRNLGIERIFVFEEDVEIAERLKDGFEVVVLN